MARAARLSAPLAVGAPNGSDFPHPPAIVSLTARQRVRQASRARRRRERVRRTERDETDEEGVEQRSHDTTVR